MAEPTEMMVEISRFGKVARHSQLYEFHSCAPCREVPRRELFAKITSLPLVLEITRFQSLTEIHA